MGSVHVIPTAHGGAYTRHLDSDVRRPGTRHTQAIERPHLTGRMRRPRAARTTLGWSPSTPMPDLGMGICVHRHAWGRAVSPGSSARL